MGIFVFHLFFGKYFVYDYKGFSPFFSYSK